MRYRAHLRDWLLTLASCACACGKDAAPSLAHAPSSASAGASSASSAGANSVAGSSVAGNSAAANSAGASSVAANSAGAAGALPAHRAYPDLASALAAIVPADARVIGFGELHVRTDRAQVTSALARFTAALPAFGARVSDLVLETWLTTPRCGEAAVVATSKIETTVKRPAATKSELGDLAAAARTAGIQAHAMTLTCDDYAAIAPPGRDVDAAQMLTVTTRELARIATSAVAHRDREPTHRPWIAVYGGALHNDRFPDPAVADWSYAPAVDRATADHFVEVDLVVPELADGDAALARQPWYPLAHAPRAAAAPVLVWTRGERSFVVLFPPS